jgi:hypothetical protein
MENKYLDSKFETVWKLAIGGFGFVAFGILAVVSGLGWVVYKLLVHFHVI